MKESKYEIKIGNQLIPVSPAVCKAYRQEISKVHYRAYKEKRCNQTDIHRCCGDCNGCPWQMDGSYVSIDTLDDKNLILESGINVEEIIINRDMWSSVFTMADTMFPDGAEMIRLLCVEALSYRQIANRIGVDHKTVIARLNVIFNHLRKKSEFFS